MPLYKQGRFIALALVVLISLMAVWNPAAGLAPQARGVDFGVEFSGGTRLSIGAQTTQATIQTSENNVDAVWSSIHQALSTYFEAFLVSMDQGSKQMVVDVGAAVTKEQIQSLIGGLGQVLDASSKASQPTLNNMASALTRRLDQYGLLGVRIKPMGENGVTVDSSFSIPQNIATTQSRFEMIIDGVTVASNSNISRIDAPSVADSFARLPLIFTAGSPENFNIYVKGRENRPLTAYLDRPVDAVLVVDAAFISGLTLFTYDENGMFFMETSLRHRVEVTALKSPKDSMSAAALQFLPANIGAKFRVILHGSYSDYSDNFRNDIPVGYKVEYLAPLSGETSDQWLMRAAGLKSIFPITNDISTDGVGSGIVILVSSTKESSAMDEARLLRATVVSELPSRAVLASSSAVAASFSPDFLTRVAAAYLAAVGVVLLIIHRKYKNSRVDLGFLLTILCETLIGLGLVSIANISFGFPELLAILLVSATGINRLLMVTEEMLAEIPKGAKVSVGWRAPKALAMARVASILAIGVGAVAGALGIEALRGFVIVAVGTTIISTLLTRPIFTRVLDIAVSGRSEK
ncbi:MAG: hypothetical protein AB1305_03950 [Candidatus Hadarchaeota archaeon]